MGLSTHSYFVGLTSFHSLCISYTSTLLKILLPLCPPPFFFFNFHSSLAQLASKRFFFCRFLNQKFSYIWSFQTLYFLYYSVCVSCVSSQSAMFMVSSAFLHEKKTVLRDKKNLLSGLGWQTSFLRLFTQRKPLQTHRPYYNGLRTTAMMRSPTR